MIQMTRYRREESTPPVQHTSPSSSMHLGGDSLAQISTNVEAQLVGTRLPRMVRYLSFIT